MFPAYDDGVWVLSLSQFGNCYSSVKLYILTTPIYGAKKQKAKVGRYKPKAYRKGRSQERIRCFTSFEGKSLTFCISLASSHHVLNLIYRHMFGLFE